MANLGYILKQDILTHIAADTLDELTNGKKAIGLNPAVPGNDAIWQKSTPVQIEKALGYIRHWYDTDKEIRTIREHTDTLAITEGQRIAGPEESGERVLYLALQDSTGEPLEEGEFFTIQDDRNAVLVEIIAHLVIYNISRRKNPRQIPEQRQIDYDHAIDMLKDIQKGRVQLAIAERENVEADDPGQEIAYGSFEGLTHDSY